MELEHVVLVRDAPELATRGMFTVRDGEATTPEPDVLPAPRSLARMRQRLQTTLLQRCRSVIRRFTRCGSGIAAVEFGMIGGMFVLFVSFWFELGLDLFMQTALDNAVRNASRLIKTGAITSTGSSAFATKLCTDLSFIMTCSNIQFNVVSASAFSALSSNITTDASNNMTNTQFSPGTSGQDVIVQVSYTRPIYIPIVSSFLGKNGNIMTYSSVAFQKEPY